MTDNTGKMDDIGKSGSSPTIFSDGVEGDSYDGIGVKGSSKYFVGVYAEGEIPLFATDLTKENRVYLCNGGNAADFFGPVHAKNSQTEAYLTHPGTYVYAGEFYPGLYATYITSNSIRSLRDHPVHPAKKYLSHSFVESSDMKNIYDGIVVLDTNGEGEVKLPDWFEALNTDFRYQLTCIGDYAPVFIARKIHNRCFTIAGGKEGMEISWQVTGIRKDVWANANRIQVETEKSVEEQGYYFAPELYGEPEEKSIQRLRHPKREEPKLSQM